jgi:hypothetical protein
VLIFLYMPLIFFVTSLPIFYMGWGGREAIVMMTLGDCACFQCGNAGAVGCLWCCCLPCISAWSGALALATIDALGKLARPTVE